MKGCPRDTDGDGNCSACARPEWRCDGTEPVPARGLMPWQAALLKRVAVMSEDERLIVCMPRRNTPLAEPIVYKIVLTAEAQAITQEQLIRIEEQLAHPDVWMKPG